jgi:DNA modification methylase
VNPAYQDNWTSVYITDALTGLEALPEKSIHCAITSPPYWGLRSYLSADDSNKSLELGAEKTPEEYVERLVNIFRELRRVLRDDGTLWINLGDSYASSGVSGINNTAKLGYGIDGSKRLPNEVNPKMVGQVFGRAPTAPGFKTKDLVGLPWMVAFALRADGWSLRSDIIWSKPNPMPESVTDRPTRSHEYLFLLTKSPRYYFDQDAVREKYGDASKNGGPSKQGGNKYDGIKPTIGSATGRMGPGERHHPGRNLRSVWNIATRPYAGSHYATMPLDLVYPCVKAGSPEGGTVLDPFSGSGTTLLAARKLGRKSIGIDLDQRNLKLTKERLGPQGVLL